jgi:hypothetical protein
MAAQSTGDAGSHARSSRPAPVHEHEQRFVTYMQAGGRFDHIIVIVLRGFAAEPPGRWSLCGR